MSILMDWILHTRPEKHNSLQSLVNFKCLDHDYVSVQHKLCQKQQFRKVVLHCWMHIHLNAPRGP